MLVIEKNNFLEKFTEINIRQRVYKGESFITLIVNTEFYPSFINSSIITPTNAISRNVPNLVKSILVNLPIRANIKNTNAAIKNTYIIEDILNNKKILANVNPVRNVYNKYKNIAVFLLILTSLTGKIIATTISANIIK